MRKLDDIERTQMKSEIPDFRVGDTVDVSVSIVETVEVKKGKTEEKERIQIFNGTVIARRGSGSRETFTVRRIVAGEGVERVFPLHSPKVKGIKVRRMGRVRRAKLYYLRDRSGKATRVTEKIWDKTRAGATEPPAPETQG
ncbi:MAG: 50S ribosomal protein L19 [Planctomycetes bacterium]|jgi:large subunit ribosomal protein L19|nr:50S ribosomal protein L19 [Planctomycetota bacterium]